MKNINRCFHIYILSLIIVAAVTFPFLARADGGKHHDKKDGAPHAEQEQEQKPAQAHSDHNAKHGGQVFMAPNGIHHLEGVMASKNEFRLYMYNEFTKPISAKPFLKGSSIEVVMMDKEGRELGKPTQSSFKVAKDGSYLRASVPKKMHFPLYFTVRLKFEGRDKPDLFNFIFVTVAPTMDSAHGGKAMQHMEEHNDHE